MNAARSGLGRWLRAGDRFALFHLINSSLSFALSFGQLFVLVRVLDANFYATVVLITSISLYLVPIDGALAKVAFVQLRDEFLKHKTTESSVIIFRLYAAYAALLLVGVLGFAVLSSARLDLILFLLFCLVANFWHFEVQTLGWAIDQGMAFEKAELIRRSCNFALLGALLVTGWFAAYSALMLLISLACMAWYARVLARAGAGIGHLQRWRWADLRDALRASRRNLGGAAAGSGADFMLMNAPYAIVTAAFGAGAPLIVLDTCLKLLRAIVMALRICSEALLPKQSAALHDGDYRGLVRVLVAIAVMSSLPALVVCGALAFTSEQLFAILLGPLASVMPSGTGLVLVSLIAAALAQNLASSFLSYSGFFGDVLKTAKIAAGLMLGLAGVALLGGISFPIFLRGYAAVFAVVGAITCLWAWLRLRRLRPAAMEAA
jgi:O-antigen/teichoic acid export membrane protein